MTYEPIKKAVKWLWKRRIWTGSWDIKYNLMEIVKLRLYAGTKSQEQWDITITSNIKSMNRPIIFMIKTYKLARNRKIQYNLKIKILLIKW
jgi:hypothetical protein